MRESCILFEDSRWSESMAICRVISSRSISHWVFWEEGSPLGRD